MGDLTITDLVVEYPSAGEKIRPLDGLNLKVPAGSLAILLGPSGCGKTTLLSCLGGILEPTSGHIEFDGIDITTLGAKDLTRYRRNTVGIVFQAFNLVPSLSALENVMVPLRASGLTRRAARKRAAELLDRVGLAEREHHKPGDLSGGQQQRVAVARAIALDPPLILADEPTAHLDFIQVEEVLRLIRELASGERVVVVATHDSRILPLADQVIELVPALATVDRDPELRKVSAGEVVFEQGTMGDLIYVVSEGDFEIIRELGDGDSERISTAGPGEYFGEIGPLFGLPRSASVRARTDGVLVGYTVQAFRERLGPTGVRDLIERKPVQIEDSPTADEPGAEEDGSGAGLGDGEQDPGDGLELAE
ncbi:ABC transporter ATP-binding protein [Mycolicibacterium fallax]|uniref:ABC transporter ATP-binding protein n=1 Tax=Mycolicibacterium fallax TaxID=1793 RepID=UPI000A15811E|nr:ATP-binding cassette domain-containing protein [Mycolicibacterium fallax]BBY97385.1 putative ABC transporter ATP-binding protein [Mycolicibacterium fallax]HOW93947.1 ATP-binding cassette domain-containing protein [Mycolicibacterium fallax]HSA40179.1 ATP-binding cassette domain-containing protein [Mycobacterium sp.]